MYKDEEDWDIYRREDGYGHESYINKPLKYFIWGLIGFMVLTIIVFIAAITRA